jgi:hypothetical protein
VQNSNYGQTPKKAIKDIPIIKFPENFPVESSQETDSSIRVKGLI